MSVGASVVAAVSATQTRRSSLSLLLLPWALALPATLPVCGVRVSWCRVPSLPGPSYLPYPTPGTPLVLAAWCSPYSGFVFFCCDPA